MNIFSGAGDEAQAVQVLAVAAAEHYDLADEVQGEELLSVLVYMYVGQINRPATRTWTSLPPLDAVVGQMAATYALSGMRGQEDIRLFAERISRRFLDEFTRAVPGISVMTSDPDIGLNAVQQAVTAILRDQDRAVELAEQAAGSFVGRLKARFSVSPPVDVALDFAAAASGEVICHAVAWAAVKLGEWAVDERDGRTASASEIDRLIEIADGFAESRHGRIAILIDHARALVNQVHVRNAAQPLAVSARYPGK
jgi:hypothetical protein|nr:hypothetical protein [Neorhizobium tomejilense]